MGRGRECSSIGTSDDCKVWSGRDGDKLGPKRRPLGISQVPTKFQRPGTGGRSKLVASGKLVNWKRRKERANQNIPSQTFKNNKGEVSKRRK